MRNSLTALESLLSGEKKTIEIQADSTMLLREKIVEQMNMIMTEMIPGSWFEGEFLNKDSSEYMVYELHLSGVANENSFFSIKLFDFGDKLRLIRV